MILSFDVGIKNLAWALISKEDKKECKLEKYGIIDLTKTNEKECDNPNTVFLLENIEMIATCCEGHKNKFKNNGKKKDVTLYEICKNIITNLEMFKMMNITTIVIENQPAMKTPKMKQIQSFLIMYFAMNNQEVILKSPNSKYFGHKFEKNHYSERKKFSIELFKKFISIEDFLNMSIKKKDDVADACLLGIAYILKDKPHITFCDMIKKNK